MWGRVIEIMTAVWLAASPFIFQAAGDRSLLWGDLVTALLVASFAGLSYWHPTRYAHLATLLVAVALIAWGRFDVSPPPPYHQNHIIIGLFLLMMAIVPNHASEPPPGWRQTN